MSEPRPRKPRFIRTPSSLPIVLADRDISILALVSRYRFIQSHYLVSLIPGSRQHLSRRLGKLFHAGFLERPRCQLVLTERSPANFAYCVTTAGQALLKAREIRTFTAPPQIRDASTALSLSHALRVSAILASTEAAAFAAAIRFMPHHEWQPSVDDGKERLLQQLRWGITSSENGSRVQTTVIPDGAFALQSQDGAPSFFVLEVDRGTMPVKRSDSTQTSFFRKVIAYKETRNVGILWKRFQIGGFRVLVVAESEGRLASLQRATASAFRNGESTMFLFAVASSLLQAPDVLAHAWQTCSGKAVRLMEPRLDIPRSDQP